VITFSVPEHSDFDEQKDFAEKLTNTENELLDIETRVRKAIHNRDNKVKNIRLSSRQMGGMYPPIFEKRLGGREGIGNERKQGERHTCK